jgi:hypothetical protein
MKCFAREYPKGGSTDETSFNHLQSGYSSYPLFLSKLSDEIPLPCRNGTGTPAGYSVKMPRVPHGVCIKGDVLERNTHDG